MKLEEPTPQNGPLSKIPAEYISGDDAWRYWEQVLNSFTEAELQEMGLVAFRDAFDSIDFSERNGASLISVLERSGVTGSIVTDMSAKLEEFRLDSDRNEPI